MSNRRVKSVAYDEDDYDDYDYDNYDEGEEQLTQEDREQLQVGTIQVRESLGPSFPATDKEIQEALWNYYYDVGKSVTYLKSKDDPSSK